MKKKTLIYIIISVLIIVAIAIVVLKNKKVNDDTYSKLDFINNQNKYIITTDMKWTSMQNDGGSHTDIYYQIDFNKGTSVKCADIYAGLEGYVYTGKVLFSKKLNETEKSQLKSILDNAIKNGTEKVDKTNFEFYEVSSFNNESIKIYNNEIINSIKNILDK